MKNGSIFEFFGGNKLYIKLVNNFRYKNNKYM